MNKSDEMAPKLITMEGENNLRRQEGLNNLKCIRWRNLKQFKDKFQITHYTICK